MTETEIEENEKYQHNGKGTAILKKRGIICQKAQQKFNGEK